MSISSVCMAGTDVYGTVDGAGTTDVSQAVSTNASVTVNGTSHDPEGNYGDILGTFSKNKEVSNGKVTFKNARVNYVNGGYSWIKETYNNEINIVDATISNYVAGGYAGISRNTEEFKKLKKDFSGKASGNIVNITNSVVTGKEIDGGASWLENTDTGEVVGNDVSNNTVSVLDSSIKNLIGGATAQGSSTGNTANISNSKINGTYINGGFSRAGAVTGNVVNITDGSTFTNDNEVGIFGGETKGNFEASQNKVVIDNIKADKKLKIYGGYSVGGSVENNTAVVSDSILGSEAASASIYGGLSQSGNAAGNSVEVDNSTVYGGVYAGGFSTGGSVSNNTATINKSTVGKWTFAGYSTLGYANNNTLNVVDSTLNTFSAGGFAGNDVYDSEQFENYKKNFKGTVSGNTVKVSGSIINAEIDGGSSWLVNKITGEVVGTDVSNNSLEASASTLNKDVIGGCTVQGTSSGNSVKISNKSTANGIVYGGYSRYGNALSNTAEIAEQSTVQQVYGGYTYTGDASGNTLNISDSTIEQYTAGGYAGAERATEEFEKLKKDFSGKVSGNIVNITNSEVTGKEIDGGASWLKNTDTGEVVGNDVSNNTISVFDSSIKNLIGGLTAQGISTENTVNISNSKTNGTYINGGFSRAGAVTGNVVNITDGSTFTNDNEVGIFGGETKGNFEASQNKVVIDNIKADKKLKIYGGYSVGGSVENNTAVVSDSILGSEAASASIYGGLSQSGNAAGNSVEVDNSTVYGGVYAGGFSTGGSVSNNTATINKSTVGKWTFAGYSTLGYANNNTLNVVDSTLNTFSAGGFAGNDVYDSEQFENYKKNFKGTVSGNTVKVSGSIINAEIDGGSSWLVNKITGEVVGTDVSNNSLEASASTLNKDVIGGCTVQGTSSGNSVKISNKSTANGIVYGGYSRYGNALSNTAEIAEQSTVQQVYGGYTYTGDASGNTLNISDSTIEQYTAGGYAGAERATEEFEKLKKDFSGKVSGNIVNITNSVVTGKEVDGGCSWLKNDDTGEVVGNDVTNNSLTVVDSTVTKLIGGVTAGGNTVSNSVKVTNSKINGTFIVGGYTRAGSATDNTLSIDKESTFINENGATVAGGFSDYLSDDKSEASNNSLTFSGVNTDKRLIVYGGYSEKGTVSNNTTFINDSILSYYRPQTNYGDGAGYYGGYGKVANNNSVEISNSNVSAMVHGGYAYGGDSTNNDVIIIDSSAKSMVFGGYSSYNSANNNTVSIIDSTVEDYVAGGFAGLTARTEQFDAHAESFSGTGNGNTVNIIRSTVNEVHGGASRLKDYQKNRSVGNEAINNIVNIDSSHITTDLLGGWSGDKNADVTTGNTLNVYGLGSTAGQVANFSKMNFYVPAEVVSGSTMLTINGGEATDLATVKAVNVGVHKDNKKLVVNDEINLLANEKGLNNFNATTGKVAESDYVNFDSRIATNDNKTKLVATITSSPNMSEDSKSPVETAAAAVNLVNTAGDMVSDQAMGSASVAVAQNSGTAAGSMAPFAATGGQSQRINSGSHVDTKGWNLNVGFAKEIKNYSGKLLFGPMVEYGRSTYDSYLDDGYHASGDNHYVGIGLMAKQTNTDGLYYEGSLRFGKMFSDYEADSATGGKYDSSSKYLGVHAGIGKVIAVNEKANVDYYAKYFLTHSFAYDTTMTANGRDYEMRFGATNSNRVKLGARYNYKVNAQTTIYTGLAWQYEFSSDNTCTIDGATAPSPSMRGHTGYLELGFKSAPNDKFEYGVGITGNVGKSRGIGANVMLQWKF